MNTLLNAVNNNEPTYEQLRSKCYNELSACMDVWAIARWYNNSNDIVERNELYEALQARDGNKLSYKIIDVLDSYPDSISNYVIALWHDNLCDGILYDANNVDILSD